MTVLAFLGAFGLLVAIHEWGHYRMAVACGVKVETFSIGLGRPLWRWRSRHPFPQQETEFLICWIPLGGYVKMLEHDISQISPEDKSMALSRQPLWKRTAIVSAGPLANLIFAAVLFCSIGWIGQFETKPILASPRPGSVAESAGLIGGELVLRAGVSPSSMHDIVSMEALNWWAIQQNFLHEELWLDVESGDGQRLHKFSLNDALSSNSTSHETMGLSALGWDGAWSAPVIGEIQPGLAAERSGLQPGDLVLSVDAISVKDARTLRTFIRSSRDGVQKKPQMWAIQRPGVGLIRLEVTPDLITEKGMQLGRVGAYIGAPAQRVWVQAGLWDGLIRGIWQTRELIGMTLGMIRQLLTGQASLDNLAGPLSMAEYAGQSASFGFTAYLSYLALISVNLGVFNLLPLPILDGGHLLYYLYEAMTGRAPTAQWLDVLQRGGLLILLALMLFSFFNDLVRMGWVTDFF